MLYNLFYYIYIRYLSDIKKIIEIYNVIFNWLYELFSDFKFFCDRSV